MSEARKEEILDKIHLVVTNEVTQVDVENDIKLYRGRVEESDIIVIDLLVYWMKEVKEEPDKISIHYAASKSPIKLPHPEHEAKMHLLLKRHVNNTIKKL